MAALEQAEVVVNKPLMYRGKQVQCDGNMCIVVIGANHLHSEIMSSAFHLSKTIFTLLSFIIDLFIQ